MWMCLPMQVTPENLKDVENRDNYFGCADSR